MAVIYIPGPNNEMIPATPPDTSSRFPINGDFATSASYAGTASYFVGFIESSSYSAFAETASYLLGSIENAVSASYALTASYVSGQTSTASYSIYSETASYLSGTASYALQALSASHAPSAPEIILSGPNSADGYINALLTASIAAPTIIDSFLSSSGNSAKWLVSINDATNYKTCEITAIWNSSESNFTEVDTNSIGTVDVSFSVTVSAGNVRLIANPAVSTWTIKMIRFLL